MTPFPQSPIPFGCCPPSPSVTNPLFSINIFMHPFNLWFPMFLNLGTLLSIKIRCRGLTGMYSLNEYLFTVLLLCAEQGAWSCRCNRQRTGMALFLRGKETYSDAESSPVWKVLERN